MDVAEYKGLTSSLIRYFRACLLADGGERELNDMLANGEKEPLFLPLDSSTATGIPPAIDLSSADGERLTATLQLKRQELRPLVGSYLVTGQSTTDETTRVRTPLFLAESHIVKTATGFQVRVDQESLRINTAALSALGIASDLAHQALTENTHFVSLMQQLAELPRRTPPETTQDLTHARRGRLTISHSAVLWLSRRSHTAASIAYELKTMAEENSHSPCLDQLLGKPQPSVAGPKPVPESLPSRLSRAQELALHNASRETLSVIHGAPGTGKTYTIAGIVADRVMRGESILIACGNEHAADVVYDQLGKSFSSAQKMVVRAGQGGYRQQLLQQLDTLLATRTDQAAEDPQRLSAQLEHGVEQQRRKATRFQHRLRRSERLAESQRLHSDALPHRLMRYWRAWRTRRNPLLAQSWSDYHQQVDAHQTLARKLLAASAVDRHLQLIRHHRQDLAGLATALRSRSSGSRTKRMGDIDWKTLTRAFPVWVVSTQTLYRSLPLYKELFDLVILDEATQCNLAQALPALQRARRAVIVGDPKQLRHFSFLARARQETFAAKHSVSDAPISLDYRERSLLDYAIDGLPHADAQVWLDEHFRSHPHLIDFSNRHFYDNRLKILTDTRRVLKQPPRQVVECPVRLKDDVNEGEIDALLDYLGKIISDSASLPEDEAPSIGVLCFFSNTARTLEKRILSQFDLSALSRHDLSVATPYGFQGTERDLILIASGVYPGRSHSAWLYLERPDVFNVAITRARHRQIIFVPVAMEEMAHQGLFTTYLKHDPQIPQPDRAGDPLHGNTRQELIAELKSLGARCWSDFPVGGQSVDLLVVKGESALAIDLVGCPAQIGNAWSLNRYNLLERAGLPPLPITYAEWLWRRADVLATLDQMLERDRGTPASQLAHKFDDLRWRFEKLGAQPYLTIMHKLSQSLEQLDIWLRRRFNVGELSYQRYRAGIDHLTHTTLTELAGIALLLEESQALTIPEQALNERLAAATDSSRKAVESLSNLARKLAMIETPSGMDEALREITELDNRLAAYQGMLNVPG